MCPLIVNILARKFLRSDEQRRRRYRFDPTTHTAVALCYSNNHQMATPAINTDSLNSVFDSLTGFLGLHGISSQTDSCHACSNLVDCSLVFDRPIICWLSCESNFNNNNSNNSKTMFMCCHHGRAITRVHPVHLMNVEVSK